MGAFAPLSLLFHRHAPRRSPRLVLVGCFFCRGSHWGQTESDAPWRKLAQEQDKFPLRSDAASRPRGIAEATRPDQIEERVRFSESGMEGIERELGDEGVVAKVGREGRSSVSAAHANAAYIRDPHASEGSPNRLAPEADGASKPHHADPSLLALDQSGRAEPGDVGPIGSCQEFVKSTPP